MDDENRITDKELKQLFKIAKKEYRLFEKSNRP